MQPVAHEIDVAAQLVNIIGITIADTSLVDAVFDRVEPPEVAREQCRIGLVGNLAFKIFKFAVPFEDTRFVAPLDDYRQDFE